MLCLCSISAKERLFASKTVGVDLVQRENVQELRKTSGEIEAAGLTLPVEQNREVAVDV